MEKALCPTTKEDSVKARNDTSSAYNTGADSSRSNSQAPDSRTQPPVMAEAIEAAPFTNNWADPGRFR